MKTKTQKVGYPALPQSKPKNGLEQWFEPQISDITKYSTHEDIEDYVKNAKKQEARLKFEASWGWHEDNFKFSHDEDYPGIPVTVELPHLQAQKHFWDEAGLRRSKNIDIYEQAYGQIAHANKVLKDIADDLDKKPPVSATRFLLDEARFSDSWSRIFWNGFGLPGQGQPLFSCEKWGFKGCLNHYEHEGGKNFVMMYQKNCARSSCVLCVESWANRIANRITQRVQKWMEISHRKSSHVVISIPDNMRLKPLKEIKKELKKVKKMVGINADAAILHPFRFEGGKGIPHTSPHFHLIAFGWIKDTKECYEKTGFVVKKISTLKNEVDVFRTAKYLLTHAGVKKKNHAVTYSGKISYSKLRIIKEDVEPLMCPHCPLELVDLRIIPQYLDRPPDFEPGYIGLTSFAGLEVIEDYDNHYYDDNWIMYSSKNERIKKNELEYRQNLLDENKRIKQDRKANGIIKITMGNSSLVSY